MLLHLDWEFNMKFMLFNFVQIRCKVCDSISNFNPGIQTQPIECPTCKEIKEKEEIANAKPKRKRSPKNSKEV